MLWWTRGMRRLVCIASLHICNFCSCNLFFCFICLFSTSTMATGRFFFCFCSNPAHSFLSLVLWVSVCMRACVCVCVCVCVSKWQPPLGQHSNPGQLFRPCGPSSAGCWVWSSGESTSEHKGLCSAPCLWVQAEQDHYTGLCSNHDNKRPQNKREALAYCQGLGKPYSRPGCKNPVCQNDSLHWVNTPTLDSCFGLVGHHQQGAECDPVESQPLNIRAYAQPLACGCKLSKITTLACAVTMTTSDHKMCVCVCTRTRVCARVCTPHELCLKSFIFYPFLQLYFSFSFVCACPSATTSTNKKLKRQFCTFDMCRVECLLEDM